jgi:hypothetical protein
LRRLSSSVFKQIRWLGNMTTVRLTSCRLRL